MLSKINIAEQYQLYGCANEAHRTRTVTDLKCSGNCNSDTRMLDGLVFKPSGAGANRKPGHLSEGDLQRLMSYSAMVNDLTDQEIAKVNKLAKLQKEGLLYVIPQVLEKYRGKIIELVHFFGKHNMSSREATLG